jgi:hypothetical protein
MTVLGDLPEFPRLPWKSFGSELVTVLEATTNKLDREWPSRWDKLGGANAVLELMSRSVGSTFHTILVLSSDDPVYPIRPEDALSVPPLARSMLDALFAVVYLFDDLPRRTEQYQKGGWREKWEAYERHVATYGNDESSADWLADSKEFLETGAEFYGISQAERADLKRLPHWPIPSQMIRDESLDTCRRERLKYLNDWFYKHLSSETHLSAPGLMLRAAALLPLASREPNRDAYLAKQRSDQVLTASLIALAFASEIEIECAFGLTPRLLYIWTILASHFDMARELYEPWYKDRLAA